MRTLCRALLWLVTAAVPVFIAACYGATYYTYRARGRVVDALTGLGINGIKVSCLMSNGAVDWSVDEDTTSAEPEPYDGIGGGDDDYDTGDETFSLPADGYFEIGFDEPCYEVRFEDVDGPDNGGEYRTKDVLFDDITEVDDAVVELELAD